MEKLKKKIKKIETFLGPKVNYNSDNWPLDHVDRWIMEYVILLKTKYYQSLKKSNFNKNKLE